MRAFNSATASADSGSPGAPLDPGKLIELARRSGPGPGRQATPSLDPLTSLDSLDPQSLIALNPHLDGHDLLLLSRKLMAFNAISGPRVGDGVLVPEKKNNLGRRIALMGDAAFQATPPYVAGSFYLGNGCVSYSGSLDEPLPLDRLVDAGYLCSQRFWFYRQDLVKTHNTTHAYLRVRVFALRASD